MPLNADTASRDSKGRFLPGYEGGPGGAREGSGPKKKPETQLRDWEKEHPNAYAILMDFLLDCVEKGKDVDAAKYLIDRLKGKPKQGIDAHITGVVIGLGVQDYQLIQEMNRKEEIELTGKPSALLDAPESPTEEDNATE